MIPSIISLFIFQKIDVWYRAASQILFSLSLGYGSQFALCSYSNFKNNTIRDAILIGICNSATSIFAGFVVFAILGFLAEETGVKVEDVSNDSISPYHLNTLSCK